MSQQQRERVSESRKQAFVENLRRGLTISDAALAASRHAKTVNGAISSFRYELLRDTEFALRVAKVRCGT